MGMGKLSLLVLNINFFIIEANVTAQCSQHCKCLWSNGNKKADCSVSNFLNIPEFNTEIQILDLTGNKLHEIKKDAFKKTGLINLKKLILMKNRLKTIHKNGFSGLDLLIELDISRNEIKTLHPDLFRDISKIRCILLNSNQIERLEDGLFNGLTFLLKVDLSDNKIVKLGLKTFMDVPKLNILRLDGNNLEYLQVETLSTLSSLSFLYIHGNPWYCDCNLLPFRNWLISKQLYIIPIACYEPPNVYGKLWKELNSNDFACRPILTYPFEKTTKKESHIKIKKTCQINENTLPVVDWVLNSQTNSGIYKYQGELQYSLEQSRSDSISIIFTINFCIVKNPECDKEQHLTLAIAPTISGVIVL